MSNANDWEKSLFAGFTTYYAMVYGLIFYPVIVMIVQFGDLKDRSTLSSACWAGGLMFLAIIGLAHGYARTRKPGYLTLLVGIYLVCLWPFIQYVHYLYSPHWDGSGAESVEILFQGINWIPFFKN